MPDAVDAVLAGDLVISRVDVHMADRSAPRQRTRWAVPLAWSLAGAAVLLQAATLLVDYRWATPMDSAAEAVGAVVMGIGTAVVGAVVAARVPANPLGWLVLAMALIAPLFGLVDAFLVVSERQVQAGRPMLPGTVAGLASLAVMLGFLLVTPVTFIPLLFPDGHLPSPRWRGVAWLAGAAITTLSGVGVATSVHLPTLSLTTDDAATAVPLLNVLAIVGIALWLTAAVMSIASLAVRWRRVRSVERQQLKWMIGGLTATFIGILAEVPPIDALLMRVWSGLPDFIGDASLLALPVSIGVAVTRYRLYEIDRLVNRTVVYTIVTTLLLLAYLALVGGLQLIVAPLAAGSQFAVAASTLAVAAAFQPVRHAVQARVDRRFNRRRYDAQRTAEAFQASLRNEVDVGAVIRALQAATARTVEPTHVTVWLARRVS